MNFIKKQKSLFDIIKAFLPPTLWALLIFLFSSQTTLPGFEQSSFDFLLKKSAHVFVYLVLYFLTLKATTKTVDKNNKLFILIFPIVICLIYAISDEIHQSFIPGRYATLRDIGFDFLGVSIAFLKKYDYI